MRKLLILLFATLAMALSAQNKEIIDDIHQTQPQKETKDVQIKRKVTLEDVNIEKNTYNDSVQVSERYIYCEIVGTGGLFSTKVKIEIDYGQEVSSFSLSSQRVLKDERGKAVKFNSMVDALNYMGSLGWEFVQAYAVTENNSNVYHFLLKKFLKLNE